MPSIESMTYLLKIFNPTLAIKPDCISPRMLPDPRNCKSFIAREYPVDVCPMDFIASSLNSASTPKFVL